MCQGPWCWAGQVAAETQEGFLEEGPWSITDQQTLGWWEVLSAPSTEAAITHQPCVSPGTSVGPSGEELEGSFDVIEMYLHLNSPGGRADWA